MFKIIYKYWVYFIFVLVFFLIYPFFVLFIQVRSWHRYGHFMNRIWAFSVLPLCVPMEIERRSLLVKDQSYVFAANHSSYLDIASLMYVLPGYSFFMGKASLGRLPLFGYMYRNLYILLDRRSVESKKEVILRSQQEIQNGNNLAIFPEGTIPKDNAPQMIEFKDGAFKIAIQQQVPIVPITMPYNHIILADDRTFTPRYHKLKIIIHEPIPTVGMTENDIAALKKKTYDIIHEELKKHNPHLQ